MTLEEIEKKIKGHYHRGASQGRIIKMWEIIGDNYEIIYDDPFPTRIVISDEIYQIICTQLGKAVLNLSVKDENHHYIIYTKRSEWNQRLQARQKEIKKQKKKEDLPYGIYCIKYKGEIVYIGMTQVSFVERWKEHKKYFLNPDLNGMVLYHSNLNPDNLTFEIMVDLTKEKADKELTTGEIKAMEMGLIAYFKPRCNISGVKIPYRFK